MSDRVRLMAAADRCFFRFLPTMLNSVVSNTDAAIELGIVIQDVSEASQQKLRRLLPQLDITFHPISAEMLAGLPNKLTLSPMAFARVLMADLTGWDKFLYLDVDVIATGDVAELYQVELGDAYLGACTPGGTINSGVLLINGASWRREGMRERIFDWSQGRQLRFADQDAIQRFCSDNFVELDARWNKIVDPIWGPPTLDRSYWEDAAITHYITGFKPWNLGRFLLPKPLVERWDRYRLRSSIPPDWRRELGFLAYQCGVLLRRALGRL